MNPTPNIPPTFSIQIYDDILTEILLRLPAKPLIRFKLVSKKWLSLISSKHFSRLHTLRHPKSQPALLLCSSSSQPHFLYFHPSKKLIPFHFPTTFITPPKILSSCNGLMLLQSDVNDVQKEDYFVYNPTTRQSRKISIADSSTTMTTIISLNLAFDPLISPHYKIVSIIENCPKSTCKSHCQIKVYDSETQSWKLRLDSFHVPTHVDFTQGVYSKNTIYWGDCAQASLYYDIDKNEIGKLPDIRIPMAPGSGMVLYSGIRESNGHLYSPVKVCGFAETSIVVFVLDEDRSKWQFKNRIVIDPEYELSFHVLSFIEEEGEGKTGVVLFQLPNKLMSCIGHWSYEEIVDFKNEVLFQGVDRGDGSGPFQDSGVHQFCPSLVPV